MGLLYSAALLWVFYIIFGFMVVGILAFCYLFTLVLEWYEDYTKARKR